MSDDKKNDHAESRRRGAGNTWTTRATWGAIVILGSMLLFIAGAVIFGGGKDRSMSRRIHCAGNLKQIGLALSIYATHYSEGGWFPDGDQFQRLEETGCLLSGKVYSCPWAESPRTLASRSAYVYHGGGTRRIEGEASVTVLAHDEIGMHPKGWVNILYADGHVDGERTKAKTTTEFVSERRAKGEVVGQ